MARRFPRPPFFRCRLSPTRLSSSAKRELGKKWLRDAMPSCLPSCQIQAGLLPFSRKKPPKSVYKQSSSVSLSSPRPDGSTRARGDKRGRFGPAVGPLPRLEAEDRPDREGNAGNRQRRRSDRDFQGLRRDQGLGDRKSVGG